MPRTINDIFPEKDYAGWLGLGLVLLVISQWMTKFDGAVFMILRWVFLLAALANYVIILIRYDQQRKEKAKLKSEKKE